MRLDLSAPKCLLFPARSNSIPLNTVIPKSANHSSVSFVPSDLRCGVDSESARSKDIRARAHSTRAKRCSTSLSSYFVLTTLSSVKVCVRPAAAPHSPYTKRSKPFLEATAPTRTFPWRHQWLRSNDALTSTSKDHDGCGASPNSSPTCALV